MKLQEISRFGEVSFKAKSRNYDFRQNPFLLWILFLYEEKDKKKLVDKLFTWLKVYITEGTRSPIFKFLLGTRNLVLTPESKTHHVFFRIAGLIKNILYKLVDFWNNLPKVSQECLNAIYFLMVLNFDKGGFAVAPSRGKEVV